MATQEANNPQAVRLDKAAKKEISDLSKRLGVSKSAIMRMALKHGLPKVKEAFA